MRLLFVPLLLAAMLLVAPAAGFAGANQEAAEKIADSIGNKYPKASVDVSYQGGKVWLKGTVTSPSERKQVIESVFNVSGVKVSEVNDEIQVSPSEANEAKNTNTAAAPAPRKIESKFGKMFFPQPNQAKQPANAQPGAAQQVAAVTPKTGTASPAEAVLAPYPYANYPAAYGQSVPPAVGPPVGVQGYPAGVQGYQGYPGGYPQQPQQAYGAQQYAPPQGAAYHPEAYGPQGPLPGQYNQANLPNYAWPAYANYPNYAQVAYPKQYSPKAWPYIGPFYPYPQVPLGWRKVTLESHDGWWWLDFDDNSLPGPFSPLFRQPMRYSY
ncbi:MAG: BON domain-containing protein [Planctomycetaceae bacterium]|jgi:hypothetical protein|nr:BON domain-containing protein [Planctomycetaceae bacterium]